MTKRIVSLLLAVVLTFAVFAPMAAFAQEAVPPTKAQIVAGVSFRDQPNTSSNVRRTLRTGETIQILQQVNPSWYMIRDQNNVTGFVSSSDKFVRLTSNAEVTASVNFRTGPSASATRIRLLPVGEELLILEKMNNFWYMAQDLNGVVGYVSTDSKFLAINTSVYKMVLPLADRIEAFIEEGMKYIGTPYEFGSARFNIDTFDCSDFVQQAFWDATGMALPSDSRAQADYVRSLSGLDGNWKNLKRGDLMFFMSYKGMRASDYEGVNKNTETVTHVGIYLGDGQMLHTFSPESGGVRIDSIEGRTWEWRFLYGGSVTK